MQQIGYVQSVLRKLREGKSSGLQNTYFALVKKGSKTNIPAYLKIFDEHDYQKANFNELLGYEIARHNKLPVPSDTFLCACKTSLLTSPSIDIAKRTIGTQHISGVASVDSNPHRFSQLDYQHPIFARDLLGWRDLALAAVFDELVVNTDRNNGNLIRVKEHDYVLIDHHQILDGEQWKLETLPEVFDIPSPKNDLANFIAESTDDVMKQRMIKTAKDGIVVPMLSDMQSFKNYEDLCGWESGTIETILELLEVRVMRLQEFIYFHLTTGQLFDGVNAS